MANINLGALSYAIEINTATGQASVKKLTTDVKGLDISMGGPSGSVGLAKSLAVMATKFYAAWQSAKMFTQFIGDTIDASNTMIKAMIGLSSVANAFGVNANDAQQAAKDLAADGLMSVADAAAGLKNLLARGFGLDEAIKLMNTFKDSAAFNRQASLSFGDAIRGATEGLKNENCLSESTILYDPVRKESKTISEWHDAKVVPFVYSIDRTQGNVLITQPRWLHFNGVKDVFRVTLSNGDSIEATDNHRFLSGKGFELLGDLKKEDSVYTCHINKDPVINAETFIPQLRQDKKSAANASKLSVSNAETISTLLKSQNLNQQDSAQENARVNIDQSIIPEQTQQTIKTEEESNLLTLSVDLAGKCLSHLKIMSSKDLDIIAQKNAEIKDGRSFLVETAKDLLTVLELSVSGAEKSSIKYPRSPKLTDFAQLIVGGIGNLKECKDKIVQCGTVAEENSSTGSEITENIKNGENKFLSAMGYDVYDVVKMIENTLQHIIFYQSQALSHQYTMSTTVLPYAESAIKGSNGELKNLSPISCRIELVKIQSIDHIGKVKTFDLTVPESLNFIANNFITHNSILVDNAGITRNVSKMWEDYAKTIGKGAMSLSDAEKRQAELNGILKEGSAFMGDAAKASETYEGKTSALGVAFFNVMVSIGNFITQSETVKFWVGVMTDAFEGLTTVINDARKGFSFMVTLMTAYLMAKSEHMTIMEAWTFAIDEAKQSIIDIDKELSAPEPTKKFESNIEQKVVKPLENVLKKAKEVQKQLKIMFDMEKKGIVGDLSILPDKAPDKMGKTPEQIALEKTQSDALGLASGSGSGRGMEGAIWDGVGTAIGTAVGAPMAGEFIGSLLQQIAEGTLLDTVAEVLMKLVSSPERIQAMIIRFYNVFLPEFTRQLPKFIAAFIAAWPTIQLAIMLSMPQMAMAFILAMVDMLNPAFWKAQWLVAWRSLEEVAFPSLSKLWEEIASDFGKSAGKEITKFAEEFGKKVSDNLSVNIGGSGTGGTLGQIGGAVSSAVHSIF